MPENKISNFAKEYIKRVSEELIKVDFAAIERAVQIINQTRASGTIYTCGNGGSASTAEHFASDLNKWANQGHESRLRAICLNSNMPQISALVNDIGWSHIYEEMLKIYGFQKKDVLVAFSVHGGTGEDKAGPYSQNLNNAIRYTNSIRAKSIGFSGFDGGNFKDICTECIIVPAESTPIVEGLHAILAHIISDMQRK